MGAGCDYGRWTALHVASSCAVARALLTDGADPQLRDTFGNSPAEHQRQDAAQGAALGSHCQRAHYY